jgi:hypothetical protein
VGAWLEYFRGLRMVELLCWFSWVDLTACTISTLVPEPLHACVWLCDFQTRKLLVARRQKKEEQATIVGVAICA